ncbi:MAG: DEAD/DEAH box helicase [Proteobacteria bacterium]|nr:DEAD/DEAH box helicase [Burkholderiales bacterium]
MTNSIPTASSATPPRADAAFDADVERAVTPHQPGTVRALRPRSRSDGRTEPGSRGRALEPLLAQLERRYGDRITAHRVAPARTAKFEPFPDDLDPALQRALATRGIQSLYSHQRQAWDSVRAGRHTVVVTPTASGKTLCYNLPALQAARESGAKSLYLFPTKALAQDQVAELLALNEAGELGVRAFTFDGDTPGDARRAVRTHADIVVSNPDMLHQAILPHHTKWAQLFESLRYVVIDEMHTYRGVFGSHVANVLRRLQRICLFYGARPTFILCSATIANPVELAERLLGAPVHGITDNGAPSGDKHVLLWNPPVINADLGLRASSRSQVTRLARIAVRHALSTIVFANSRLAVEVLTKYLKDVFDPDPRAPPRVAAYRGGYLPTERRDIERRLRAGTLDCVVSTSALELGVDIGALDVCLLNGYPGTIAGTWQRLGRAGRRQRTSLGVLVASSEPLDQYIVRHPEFFFGASPEHALIDPDQLLILMEHIRCAAFELPFEASESFGAPPLSDMLDYLASEQVVHREGDRWHWIADSYPANSVSLRAIAEGNFVVIDATDGARNVIAEVDWSSAPLTLYEGAIYMVQSRPWQVERLDWEGRKAFVTRTDVDYYTDAIDYTRLKVLDDFEHETVAHAIVVRGEVHVVRRVAGYKKIRYYTHENIGYGEVRLPDHEMHTSAVWWRVDPQALERAFAKRWQALDGFLGAAYALHHVAALVSMCEVRDLGRAVGDADGRWHATIDADGRGRLRDGDDRPLDLATLDSVVDASFSPTVFLYDNHPGGVGLSTPLYDLRDKVLAHAAALVHACDCAQGCPACVGPILNSDEKSGRDPKRHALVVLALLGVAAPKTLDAQPLEARSRFGADDKSALRPLPARAAS